MKLRDMTELAVRNLREAIFRNTLTTLGVAVGVASLVAMLSLGVGLQQLASSRLTKSGLFDTVFVSPKLNLRGGPPAAATQQPATRLLDEDARLEISRLPNVIEVFPQIRFPTEVRFSDKPFPTVVAGMPLSSKLSGSFDGMKGEFFTSESADEAILQIEFAKELSPDTAGLVGKTLAIRYAERQQLGDGSGGFSIVPKEKQLRIIGVVETEPASGFGGYGNGRLLIPIGVAQSLRAAQINDLRDVVRGGASKPTYASLTVRAKSTANVDDIEAAVKKMGFGAFSLLDIPWLHAPESCGGRSARSRGPAGRGCCRRRAERRCSTHRLRRARRRRRGLSRRRLRRDRGLRRRPVPLGRGAGEYAHARRDVPLVVGAARAAHAQVERLPDAGVDPSPDRPLGQVGRAADPLHR